MRLVIDASVAVKWVVHEEGSAEAVALRQHELLAPELWAPECANVLWKKRRRGEISAEHAQLAVALLQRSDVVLLPMLGMMAEALALSERLDHPAYDGFYLAAARAEGAPLVTADARLVAKAASVASPAVLLRDAPSFLTPRP